VQRIVDQLMYDFFFCEHITNHQRTKVNTKMTLLVGLLRPAIIAIASIVSVKIFATIHDDRINQIAMGIFRDIGRYKAKKRRNMSSKGLISTLMKKDDVNEEMKIILDPENEDQTNLPTYTEDELLDFGNGKDGKPILIGVLGHVYDVSAGKKFYGEDGDYSQFAGHDITYSLGTGCKAEHCVEMKPDDTFTEKQLSEAKRWLSFFHLHDKYHIVGKMESDYVANLLDDLIEKNDTEPETTTETASSSQEESATS
jgi:predicted heme/steroid binding protein